MKFWNKSKKYRETWTKMEGPGHYAEVGLKYWCQQQPSKGRFYVKGISRYDKGYGLRLSHRWYFEDPKDALVFKLKFLTK